MAIVVERYAVGGFDANLSYLLVDDAANQALLIDPAGAIVEVLRSVEERQISLDAVFLTHSHQDHWDGLDQVLAAKSVPVLAHPGTLELIDLAGTPVTAESTIALGEAAFIIIETPGHSPDSVCVYIAPEQSSDGNPHLISGDTVFVDGCGRTVPEAAPALFESLQRLKTLPPETIIHPGHDYGPTPQATLSAQLKSNRFLVAPNYETFYRERFPDTN